MELSEILPIFANDKQKFLLMSPVFRRDSEYTFKIYSNEEERMHIHVLRKIVEKYADEFKKQYREHIGKRVDD